MTPAYIIPWQSDLITALAEYIVTRALPEQDKGDLNKIMVIFPHRRPRRYLLERLSQDSRLPKPLFPPEILSSAALLHQLRLSLEADQPPRTMLPPLDQALLLQEAVLELRGGANGLSVELPAEDILLFLPWGLRLAKLLEDLYRENRPAQDLNSIADEVRPFAAILLENLGRIEACYKSALDARRLTTPGYDLHRLAQLAEAIPSLLKGRRLLFAGFERFSGVEAAVFGTILRSGQADIFLHGDSRLITEPKRAHWSCQSLTDLLAEHGLRPELWDPYDRSDYPCAKLRYYEGFDLHSQLDTLADELKSTPELQDTLVMLPDTGLLMPVLHHLQGMDVNVGMGYPLSRSPLAKLVETILRLQETSQDQSTGRTYAWRDMIGLIRHPYIKMLERDGRQPLRQIFRLLEQRIREGGRHLDPLSLLPATDENDVPVPQENLDLAQRVFASCLSGFADLKSPGDLAEALKAVCDLLVEQQDDLWKRFPLDAECLHRLLHQVIPSLRNSLYNEEPLGPEALFSLLRQLIQDERAPFESDTTGGVQILGVLETRALRFNRILLLDVTEQHFPGLPVMDPLLPDSLRILVGLPNCTTREQQAAYRFFRLLWGAEEAALLYRQGGQESGLLDKRSSRSRFIEELLFEEEKRQGKILEGNDSPVQVISYPVKGIHRSRRSVLKTPEIRRRLEDMFSRPITASKINDYLRCPLQFYYRHLTVLEEELAVQEEEDLLALGELVHSVLQVFFEPVLGVPVGRDDLGHRGLTPEWLLELFADKLRQSCLNTLPIHQRMGLDMSCRSMLRAYLENFPRETTILRLESSATAVVKGVNRSFSIKGRMDRLDQREHGLVILDYKTGSVPNMPKFWEDEELWIRMELWEPPDSDPELFELLASRLPVAQLPCYLFLAQNGWGESAWDAGLVELRNKGTEKWLWGSKLDENVRKTALNRHIPLLLRYLLGHMDEAPEFKPMPDRRCQWCPYSGLCAQ